MKKYIKPDLYCESFELSQHIATCAWDMAKQSDPSNCSASQEGYPKTIFADAGACQQVINPNQLDDYCYTNGAESNKIFNS